jgi:hypothetical protein
MEHSGNCLTVIFATIIRRLDCRPRCLPRSAVRTPTSRRRTVKRPTAAPLRFRAAREALGRLPTVNQRGPFVIDSRPGLWGETSPDCGRAGVRRPPPGLGYVPRLDAHLPRRHPRPSLSHSQPRVSRFRSMAAIWGIERCRTGQATGSRAAWTYRETSI